MVAILSRPQCVKYQEPEDHLNIKMLSYRYMCKDSYYKNKMVVRLSYLYNVNPIPIKTVFILKQDQGYCGAWWYWQEYTVNTPTY